MPSIDRIQREYDRVLKILKSTPFHKCFDCGETLIQVLPQNPGHYVFKTADGEILYIGKTSNLRTRLTYAHHVFRRLWLDQISPTDVRLMWTLTPARYLEYDRWIEKRMIFTLRPRYNDEIPKNFDEVNAMQQLQSRSVELKQILQYLPSNLLDAIEDYADNVGLSDQQVVELAFSMFFDLNATSFGELESLRSPGMLLEENRSLELENAALRQELQRLKSQQD